MAESVLAELVSESQEAGKAGSGSNLFVYGGEDVGLDAPSRPADHPEGCAAECFQSFQGAGVVPDRFPAQAFSLQDQFFMRGHFIEEICGVSPSGPAFAKAQCVRCQNPEAREGRMVAVLGRIAHHGMTMKCLAYRVDVLSAVPMDREDAWRVVRNAFLKEVIGDDPLAHIHIVFHALPDHSSLEFDLVGDFQIQRNRSRLKLTEQFPEPTTNFIRVNV